MGAATQVSRFAFKFRKKMLKPFKSINKRIHEATGESFPGGDVKNPPARKKETANFKDNSPGTGYKKGFK